MIKIGLKIGLGEKGEMRDKLLQLGINTFKKAARYHHFLPRQVKVETTKACNLKCVGCRRNFAETLAKMPGPKHLTVEALGRIVATTPIQVVRFEGDGEPTVNPHFRDLVQFCHRVGIRSAMTTNATLLDRGYVKFLEENGMRRIHVSFDGAKKKTFEKQRVGASYDQVLEACGLIGKSKIQLFMNIVPSTDEIVSEMLDYVDLAKEVGATGILPIKFQADKSFGTPIDWSKYDGTLEIFKWKVKERGLILASTSSTGPAFAECEDAYVCPYIVLGNDVYACAYMANMRTTEIYMGEVTPTPHKNYVMGNLNDNSMKDIWKGKAYKELWSFLKATRMTGGILTREDLLEVKKDMVGKARFSYCASCLCRWSETGL